MTSVAAALRASPAPAVSTSSSRSSRRTRLTTPRGRGDLLVSAASVSAPEAKTALSATMSVPMKVSEACKLAPKIAMPHHPTYSVADAIRVALEEDVADVGDISSLSTIPIETVSRATLLAKADGVLAGQALANQIMAAVDPDLMVSWSKYDGDSIAKGELFMEVKGSAHSILRAERVILNFMQRMSGIATLTKSMAEQAAPAFMLETRKTVPGLRLPDKWAVLIGGGKNHRMGLFDMIMIKDNHIAASGGIRQAVANAQNYLAEKKLSAPIEVETSSIAEVNEVLALLDDASFETGAVSRIMLDNMSLADMTAAVALIAGRVETEASGNVTLATVHGIGQTGVTFISSGALTHSVMALDISLNIE